ncbi:hypothetical protein [Micromonospora sp. NPDC048947]|uniref:hypothetical protein n=1 Tax=Micromonospora sp. NPDC048947 TaxID=3154826 RepID=UPI0033F596C6
MLASWAATKPFEEGGLAFDISTGEFLTGKPTQTAGRHTFEQYRDQILRGRRGFCSRLRRSGPHGHSGGKRLVASDSRQIRTSGPGAPVIGP